ncbi:endonuclease/exonuclease/phosphatase family protein [Paenibacillus sp. LHD-117]|uniref:endonuclease/exonuclease/phosphatase family protein n=1 Tax=Paenibacillus sp. LHD-117 TaxID=3071412 RepID=UPI0027E1418A|nr:endonuclease/exonuclease/phosphatase family protein [Paenibacillus sp. LHD-117]MDQ6419971.1 endonuclease/exonuclease/phosphatase family protein [Paenibacillus sp. LHD-117]
MKLNVMTFNLRVNVPSDGENAWPYRKEQAAAVIREMRPLLVGTQEGRYAMLNELDALLPAYSRIGEGRAGYESGDEGLDECCAIYYDHGQLKLVEHGQFWLSETPDSPSGRAWDADYPRFCSWARFEWADAPEEQFYLFNTHFDHVGQQAREESAKLILRKIASISEREEYPFIVTGDLNCYPDDPAIRTLKAELTDVYESYEGPVGRTFHDFQGGLEGEPIDYIFASGDVSVVETTVYRGSNDGVYPSDHYPVMAQLAFESKRQP